MISVCTVASGTSTQYLAKFVKSLSENCHFINEVVVCYFEREYAKRCTSWGPVGLKSWDGMVNFFKETEEEMYGVKVKKFHLPRISFGAGPSFEHSIGLHNCIPRTTNDYVLFSDPDVIVFSDIDRLYLDLMQEHNLHFVGVSHYLPDRQPYLFMPTVINMMTHKSHMPDKNFLHEKLTDFGQVRKIKVCGNWLVPGQTPEYNHEFPNSDPQVWDTGNKLHLHCKWNNKRWLSFVTKDEHNYDTSEVHDNCGLELSLPFQKLIYHEGSSSYKPLQDTDFATK
jgi:hypothetical protein